MIYPNITVPEGLNLELFNAVEVHPVEYLDGGCNQVDERLIGSNPEAEYFWSVYLHFDYNHPENNGFGGLECIADLPSKEAAYAYAEGVERTLGHIVGDRLIRGFA